MDRCEELVSEYLDGALDSAGRAELAQLVERDPERLRELVDLVREHRILSFELGEPPGAQFTQRVIADLQKDKTRFVRAVMTDIRGPRPEGKRPKIRQRRPWRPHEGAGPAWMLWAACAAVALTVLGVLVLALGGRSDEAPPDRGQARIPRPVPSPPPPVPREDPVPAPKSPDLRVPEKPRAPEVPPAINPPPPLVQPPNRDPAPPKTEAPPPAPPPVETKPAERPTRVTVATLERADGAVTVGKEPAKAGQTLPAGFEVETVGPESVAGLRFPDGTRLEILGASRLRDQGDARGRRVFVEGAIAADIAKQPADQPMVFATALAEATIVGTKIRLDTTADSTWLRVTEGRVRFTRLKDKMSVEVTAGHSAGVAPNTPFTSRLSRVTAGLAALYTFKEGRGTLVHDLSRVGVPINLTLDNESAARWSPKGLLLLAPTIVASEGPVTRIVQACKASNELTLEAWIRPATVAPAAKDGRILTLSADPMNQDFMLGQDEMNGPTKSYFVRLRTTTTDLVGKPALASPDGSAAVKLTHVIYTRGASGTAVLYIDGLESARTTVGGTLSSWSEGFRLSLGNEMTKDRPWLGEYHLAAVYSRALSAEDVKQNYRAGAE